MPIDPDIIKPFGPDSVLDRILIEEYAKTHIILDQLPYTEAFESLFSNVRKKHTEIDDTQFDRSRIYHRLLTLRKMARLPKLQEIKPNMDKVAY